MISIFAYKFVPIEVPDGFVFVFMLDSHFCGDHFSFLPFSLYVRQKNHLGLTCHRHWQVRRVPQSPPDDKSRLFKRPLREATLSQWQLIKAVCCWTPARNSSVHVCVDTEQRRGIISSGWEVHLTCGLPAPQLPVRHTHQEGFFVFYLTLKIFNTFKKPWTV